MDRVRAGVDAEVGELLAQRDDLFLDRGRHPRRRRARPLRHGPEPVVAELAVAADQLIQPAAGNVVGFAHVGDAAPLDQHRVDDIASQIHAHSPSCSCPACLATGVRDLMKPDTPRGAAWDFVRVQRAPC